MTSLSAPCARRPLHTRRIVCDAFERDDGLIDIEASLLDTKPDAVTLLDNRVVGGGEPIHQMHLRITVDRERWIRGVEAVSESHPYPECKGAEASYQALVGLRIEPGFTKQVKALFRGEVGCTHVSELVPVMATIIYQVIWGDSGFDHPGAAGATHSPTPLGGCHALRLEGQIVQTYFSGSAGRGNS